MSLSVQGKEKNVITIDWENILLQVLEADRTFTTARTAEPSCLFSNTPHRKSHFKADAKWNHKILI